jgi:hypothetical protein
LLPEDIFEALTGRSSEIESGLASAAK